jgi:DNA-binding HxlR family transcriptional regulator
MKEITMRASHLSELNCPIARTVGVVGDAWSLMIVRELYLGSRRFDQFQSQLRAPTALLSERLKALEKIGIIKKHRYQSSPARYEYRLTSKGIDLWPLMIALKHWGDRWGGWTKSSPASLLHKTCGCTTGLRLTCECCGEPLSAFDVELKQLPPMANERCELEILNRERNKEKARQRRKSAA